MTRYEFQRGWAVTHTRRADGRHEIEIRNGIMRSTGTYGSIECLDIALDTISMAVGPWVKACRE